MRFVKREEIAAELLQDVFLKLWEKRETWVDERPTGGLLYGIAQNLVTDLFRRAACDRQLLDHLGTVATEL